MACHVACQHVPVQDQPAAHAQSAAAGGRARGADGAGRWVMSRGRATDLPGCGNKVCGVRVLDSVLVQHDALFAQEVARFAPVRDYLRCRG